MSGQLHDPKTLFFVVSVGTAKDGAGSTYAMAVSAGDTSPIVRNKKTGRWFTLSWPDILNLAKDAGIDKPFAPEGANRLGHRARTDIAKKRRRT